MGETVPGVTIRQAGEVSVTLERNQQAVVLWKSDDEASSKCDVELQSFSVGATDVECAALKNDR